MFRIYWVLLISTIVSLCSFCLHFQTVKTIKVAYYIDNIEQHVYKNSRVLFVNNLDTLEGEIDSVNQLNLPHAISNYNFYEIVFLHKSDTLSFKKIDARYLKSDQNYEWRFGIDNRPFDNLLGILSYEEYLKDTVTQKLNYWQLNPLEKGDGGQFYNKIGK